MSPPLLYFSFKELACRDTHAVKLADGFGDKLVLLRTVFARPMVINSACRSSAYNAKLGGHSRSLHVYDNPVHPTGGCCAVDIRCPDGTLKGVLIRCAWELGWSVGVHKTFVHLDRRTDYTALPQMFFTYRNA